ncbi:type I restriction enzyme S subunit [Nitrobacter vulgaris]|uniref:restriction endonuclease subunit S n=1 Tax=Nitrobacter vulgaris TaxID=29421 RepID=UPI0028649CB7|nr:restriction endonuclease subunit S [Nitrobacter vulgaris]MDR6304623.1 type I restriction enzyme S subunit [Nitrobacter vulgaris]
MNAERLLAQYEKIAEAPDAIARLRRFIIDLAVRGKLVPQDATDEPAPELLKRIAKEKARLVKAGKLRDRPELLVVADDQAPFGVPSTWLWVRFSSIADFSAGRTPSRHDPSFWNTGDHAWVSIADMEDGHLLSATKETVSDRAKERVFGSEPEEPGTIIMSFKLTIGKIARLGVPAFHNEAIISIHPHVAGFDGYLFKVLPQFARQGEIKGAIKGATLNRDSISNILLPLPPLAEQHRIVAKVDKLMSLCDRLEGARASRERSRDRLTAASLARLNAPDPETFEADARFALHALPALTRRPDQIKALRQTILNLAVRGKLVPQDPNDELASELFARMVKERKEMVARRKIRGATPPKPPSAEKEGFDLPASWRLCALGQITLITDPNPSHRYPDYSGGTVPILSTREFLGDDGWNPKTAKLTTQAFWEFQKEICDFAEHDIIFARKGRLGLPRFLPPFEKFTFSHTLFSIKPMTGLDPAYLLWLLRRDEVVAWLTNEMNQNTGVPREACLQPAELAVRAGLDSALHPDRHRRLACL